MVKIKDYTRFINDDYNININKLIIDESYIKTKSNKRIKTKSKFNKKKQ